MTLKFDRYWLTLYICGLPLLWLLVDMVFNHLGADPIKALHVRLGDWSLRFLCITLAVTPVQKITRWRGMADYRQLFGVYAFVYSTLHVLVYLTIDHGMQWQLIWIDVLESSYIWFGVIAFVIVFALGLTSTNASKRWLGVYWKKLHRLIYIAIVAAVVHYFWQLKGNLADPFMYAIFTLILLGFRVLIWYGNQRLSKMMIPKGREDS